MHNIGAGTGTAAIQRQQRGVGVIGQAGVIRYIGCQLNGKAAVFARCHGDGQVGNAPADASQHSFILYSHIFVQSALTVGGIQLPNRGLHNVSVLQMQLARADGLPEPLASLRLILGVRPGLQPRRHQAAPIGCLRGLGGVKVDAAVHQLHLFAGKGMGFLIITADKCYHIVSVVELTGRTHFHRSDHQYMLAVQREKVRALPHFAVHVVVARQHGNKMPVETVLALEQYGCTAAVLGQGNGHGRVGAVSFAPDLRVTEVEFAVSFRQIFLGQHRVAGRFFVIQSIAHSNALGLNIPHFTIRLFFRNHAGVEQ